MYKYFQQIDIETTNNVKNFQMSSTKILSLFIAGSIAVAAIILMLACIISVGPGLLIILIDIIAELAVIFLMNNDKTPEVEQETPDVSPEPVPDEP